MAIPKLFGWGEEGDAHRRIQQSFTFLNGTNVEISFLSFYVTPYEAVIPSQRLLCLTLHRAACSTSTIICYCMGTRVPSQGPAELCSHEHQGVQPEVTQNHDECLVILNRFIGDTAPRAEFFSGCSVGNVWDLSPFAGNNCQVCSPPVDHHRNKNQNSDLQKRKNIAEKKRVSKGRYRLHLGIIVF